MLGMIFGVGAVVAMLSITEGAQKEILLAARKLADDGTIALGGKGGDEYV